MEFAARGRIAAQGTFDKALIPLRETAADSV
jgi:hypothetical protein